MKTKTFKCHTCRTIILTDKSKPKCKNCGSEYTLKDRKYYRENTYSKWAKKLKGK